MYGLLHTGADRCHHYPVLCHQKKRREYLMRAFGDVYLSYRKMSDDGSETVHSNTIVKPTHSIKNPDYHES